MDFFNSRLLHLQEMWVLALLLVVIGMVWLRGRRCGRLPPGPRGLPLVGYLPWMNGSQPYLTLTELARRYGPVYGIRLGGIYTVVLSDVRLVRKTLARDVFTGRADLYLTHGIMQGYGLVVAEGERWKQQRRFVISTLKNLGVVKVGQKRSQMEEKILFGVKDVVKLLEDQEGGVDPVKPMIHSLGNVLNSVVFGVTWSPEDPTWLWLQELAEEGVKLIGISGPINFLPFLRWVPKYKNAMKFLIEGKEKTHEVYRKILKEAKGEDNVGAAFLREMAEGRGGSFVETQMHHLLADMWGAGVDTTLTTLRWFLLYMAAHPTVQDRVQEEIDLALGDREWPSLEDIPHLPYTEAALSETQRIRSVVPLGLPHAALEDTEIEGYLVPRRTMVLPLQWALHMDPAHFPDPQKFDPTRFIDSSGKFFKPEAFIPFQSGKRVCLGEEMARMMMFLFGVGILRHYSVSPKSDLSLALQGICGITLVPGHHRLAFVPRTPYAKS